VRHYGIRAGAINGIFNNPNIGACQAGMAFRADQMKNLKVGLLTFCKFQPIDSIILFYCSRLRDWEPQGAG